MLEHEAILAELTEVLEPTSCVKENRPASLILPRCSAASSILPTVGHAEVGPAVQSMSSVTYGRRRGNAEESYGDI